MVFSWGWPDIVFGRLVGVVGLEWCCFLLDCWFWCWWFSGSDFGVLVVWFGVLRLVWCFVLVFCGCLVFAMV